jgi:hypothetical protein
MANDPTPAVAEALALSGGQNASINTQASACETIRAGRQVSDIPMNDPYWNAVDTLRRLYDSFNAPDVILE